MWRNAGIKIIISGTLNWSTVGILNFFVLFCFVVFFPVQAGLWDHRPIGGTFPKSQTDLCLRRHHAVGGERPANSRERSEQEQPGDTGGTPVNLSNLWTLMRVWTRGAKSVLKRNADSRRSASADATKKITALMTKQQWIDLISWKCSLWSNQTLSAVAV